MWPCQVKVNMFVCIQMYYELHKKLKDIHFDLRKLPITLVWNDLQSFYIHHLHIHVHVIILHVLFCVCKISIHCFSI